MPTKLESILIVPDAHIPYHDWRAWGLMLKAARALKPSLVVCIGDLADCYAVSSHSKNPKRALALKEELAEVNLALDQLDALGAKERLFIEGNHSDRLTRYLKDRAPELFEIISIPALFGLKRRGWQFVPYKQHARRGKVYYTHDVGTAGRYAVYKALDTFAHSVVTGHTHRLAYIVEGNAVGECRVSAQFGWLGDVEKVDYMHKINAKKNWALGFGVGYLHPTTGVTYLCPVPIVNYTCVVNGVLYAN